jgi:hypothetical protein
MLRTLSAIRARCHLVLTNQSSDYEKLHSLSIVSHHSPTVFICNPLKSLRHLAGSPGGRGVIRSCHTLVRVNTICIYNNKQPTKKPIARSVTHSYAPGCQIICLACTVSKIKRPHLAQPVGNTGAPTPRNCLHAANVQYVMFFFLIHIRDPERL